MRSPKVSCLEFLYIHVFPFMYAPVPVTCNVLDSSLDDLEEALAQLGQVLEEQPLLEPSARRLLDQFPGYVRLSLMQRQENNNGAEVFFSCMGGLTLPFSVLLWSHLRSCAHTITHEQAGLEAMDIVLQHQSGHVGAKDEFPKEAVVDFLLKCCKLSAQFFLNE